MESPGDLDALAYATTTALSSRRPLNGALLRALRRELLVRAGSAGIASADREEVADAVLERFVRQVLARKVHADGAGAYLAVSIRNELHDRHRRRTAPSGQSREIPLLDAGLRVTALADDEIARMLDSSSAAASVQAGLRRAAAAGRSTVIRVVTEWLETAELSGSEPSLRTIAFNLDLSHTTIASALGEFRDLYLPDPGSDA